MIKALALLMIMLAPPLRAEVVVIGNTGNGLDGLTSGQAEDIFMGRTQALPNGKTAKPVDQAALRSEFYRRLVNRSVEQIDAYWARIVFTGKNAPPPQLPGDEAVIAEVRKNPAAVGYVARSQSLQGVRVLLVLP